MNEAKTERNMEVVRLHVEERLTLQSIGDLLGISRERCRQIVRRAGVTLDVTARVRAERWAEQYRDGYVEVVCEQCGETAPPRAPSRIGKGRFCSSKCGAKNRGLADEWMLCEMRRLALSLGHTPRGLELVSPLPHWTTYYNHFGSLVRAQEMAGLTPNGVGGYPGKTRTPLPNGFREQWAHLLETAG